MNKKFSPPAIGGSSLLVIFAVLCLTVFALLSVSTVRANEQLGNISAESIENYYAADCAAELVLAQLRGGQFPEGVKEENGIFSYICAVSDTQALEVEVSVDGGEYTVLRWQTVSTLDWEADDTIIVWDGES